MSDTIPTTAEERLDAIWGIFLDQINEVKDANGAVDHCELHLDGPTTERVWQLLQP